MTNLIVADAEIELIPESIARHPAVRASSSRRGKSPSECLLDSSLHYSAMRTLEDGGRRGRADIAHFCLLLALDSIPSREGRLKTYVHTRNNRVMEFSPDVRLPKNLNRFSGLLEKALLTGSIDSGSGSLVTVSSETLKGLLTRLGGATLLLSEEGRGAAPDEVRKSGNLVVGGFPHGDFISDLSGISVGRASLYRERLMAWTAVSILTSIL